MEHNRLAVHNVNLEQLVHNFLLSAVELNNNFLLLLWLQLVKGGVEVDFFGS